MRRGALLVVVAGCGRVDFDARMDAPGSDAAGTDLIAHYTMDSITGNTVTDSSGHRLDATCTSCPSADIGVAGGALRFDGATTLVSVSSPLFDQATEYTVAFWMRLDQSPPTASCMVGKRYGTGTGNSWQICVNSSRSLFYSSWNGSANDDVTPGATVDGMWHHLAITFAAPTETLYLDGASISSVPRAKPFDTGSVEIGADIDATTPLAYFSGWIDDIRIYSRALAATEIDALDH